MDLVELFEPILIKINKILNNMKMTINKCDEISKILLNHAPELSLVWHSTGKNITKLKTNFEILNEKLKKLILNYEEQANQNNYNTKIKIQNVLYEMGQIEHEISDLLK